MSAPENGAKANGHSNGTASSSTNGSSVPNNDILMKHIVEHLRSRGLSHTVGVLQQELKDKPDTSTAVNGENTRTSRKRTFSEITDSKSPEPSHLKRIYDDFEHRNTMNHSNGTVTPSDSIMSTKDISLQSFGKYESVFVKSNGPRVCCISFSGDGRCIGVGGVDGTVRVFDVNKLHQSSNFNLIKKYDSTSYSALHRPIICTLSPSDPSSSGTMENGQSERVYEISFAPFRRHLVSCFDGGIHLFDFAHKLRKTAILTINECFTVRTVQYHPAGQYVLAGGQSSYVRLYDVEKEQGFIAKRSQKDEYDLNQIRWGLCGNVFASCSERGDIRIYDGRTMATVNTLRAVHCGQNVTSIRFNTDCKYLLSSGYDDVIRLTDLRMGRQCQQYTQCRNRNTQNPPQQFQACFTYNDEHVVACSNVANRIFVYDTNSGHRITNFKDHATDSKNTIDYIACSPTEPAFMCSSSGDRKNRFYAPIKRLSAAEQQQLTVCVEEESPLSNRSQNSLQSQSSTRSHNGQMHFEENQKNVDSDPLAPMK